MHHIIDELKNLFDRNTISLFAIADSKALENEPEGYRPSDILSCASSILCFGIPVPKGVFQDQKRVNKNYWRMASIYYHNIDIISSQASIIIESHGEIATPILS